MNLVALGAELHVILDRVARQAAGLGLAPLRALMALADAQPNPLEPHELARALRMASNHMTKVVDQLEGLGLLERRQHPTDRRRRLLAPTAEGRALARSAAPVLEDAQERIVREALTDEERDRLGDMVIRLRRMLWEQIAPVATPRPGP